MNTTATLFVENFTMLATSKDGIAKLRETGRPGQTRPAEPQGRTGLDPVGKDRERKSQTHQDR